MILKSNAEIIRTRLILFVQNVQLLRKILFKGFNTICNVCCLFLLNPIAGFMHLMHGSSDSSGFF